MSSFWTFATTRGVGFTKNGGQQEIFNKLEEIADRALGSKKTFYEAIVHQIDDRKNNFKDKTFENSLRELAKQ